MLEHCLVPGIRSSEKALVMANNKDVPVYEHVACPVLVQHTMLWMFPKDVNR
jgi:hypothetical protein